MTTMQTLIESGNIHGSKYDRRKFLDADIKRVIDFLMDDLPSEQWETLPQYMQDEIIAVHTKYEARI